MINLTLDELVFAQTGAALHQSVRGAMVDASFALIDLLGLTEDDLATVSTKTNVAAAYAWLTIECTLKKPEHLFNESFINSAYKFYKTGTNLITEDDFYALTLGAPGTRFEYRLTYQRHLNRGVGLFMIALHSRGAITLPMTFDWPFGLAKNDQNLSDGIMSELLGFLTTLDPKSHGIPHQAFASVGTTKKRKEWFLTYGRKLLLATGWHRPSDANLEDLDAIKEVQSRLGIPEEQIAYRALIDVLSSRFSGEFGITVEGWTAYLRTPTASARRAQRRSSNAIERCTLGTNEGDDEDILNDILDATPAAGSIEALRSRPRLPGRYTDLTELSRTWLDLESIYRQTVKREAYKPIDSGLGYLNIYLFLYLPYWFQRNPETTIEFPDVPSKLLKAVFVSRLGSVSAEAPKTFIEMMDAMHARRDWENNSYYGMLKQVEVFLSFLEDNNEDLPGCRGFRQPIPEYAYPATTSSRGTNKRPIPRRIFGVALDYVEALRAHLDVVLSGIVNDLVDAADLAREFLRTGHVIDTFATSSIVGFIPLIFTRGKTIPLRYIPNTLCFDDFPIAAGRMKKLPQPHSLNQILVALYTGLRHNHIQWLDARTFDSAVTDEHGDFTRLNVNTDKSKTEAWQPHVNFRVIEVLRNQLEWRSLVRWPSFSEKKHYNNNPQTKWAPILPLFSAGSSGLPHSDGRYTEVWQDLICALEALLPNLGEKSMQRLCSLEPPGVTFNDPLAQTKREEYGISCKRVCELGVKSLITPHSARVTVVSQYSTFLPAEYIGTNITGQKADGVRPGARWGVHRFPNHGERADQGAV